MVAKRWIAIYAILAVLTGLSYASIRNYLISTPINNVIISNLTVNYVLAALLFGGVAGWLAWTRLFRGRPLAKLLATLVASLLASMLWMAVMSAGGYQLR